MVCFRRVALVLGSFFCSAVALGAAEDTASAVGWAKISAAFVLGLGAFGAATGQGRAASSALAGLARNPSSKGDVFVPMLLSLVFMEFQALMCFVMAFLLLG